MAKGKEYSTYYPQNKHQKKQKINKNTNTSTERKQFFYLKLFDNYI